MNRQSSYDSKNDNSVNLESSGEVLGASYKISAGTEAGRKDPDVPSKPNEDAFCVVASENKLLSLAVFDGASSQKPIPELGEETGARYASHTLKEIFENLPSGLDTSEKLKMINRRLGEKLHDFSSIDYEDMNSLPTATATIVELDFVSQRISVSHVGDSFAMVEYKDGTSELLTNDLWRKHDEVTLKLISDIAHEKGITPREAREDERVRRAIMKAFQSTRNNPDGSGLGMVNGDPNMESYIHNLTIDLEGVRAVLLGRHSEP